MKKLFSIVIPIYKNELNLPVTIPYIIEEIPRLFPSYQVELILVNDGSPDRSWEIMKDYQRQYPEIIRIISLIHNFGQGNAVKCGMSIARGEAIGIISADLQDPFDLFPVMLKELETGYDMVCGVREGRNEHGLNACFSKITHFLIKHLISTDYPKGGFDFSVLSRNMAERILHISDRNGSGQLLMLWASGATKFIPYTRKKREIGKSSWTFSKKLKYFIDTFVSDSYFPIRAISAIGIVSAGISFLAGIYLFISAILMKIGVIPATGDGAPGWTSIVLLIIFFSGLILTSLGIIGEYLWRIFDEARGRPLYIIKEKIDAFESDESRNKTDEAIKLL